MAENCCIRPFGESDWCKVRKIFQQGIDTNLATFRTVCPTYDEWNRKYLDKCRFVYVLNEKIRGWVALTSVSDEPAYSGVAEVNIYVENKSKHQGIGTLLLKQVIEKSEQEDIWTLQATIMHNNYSCILLFQNCGFREVGFRNKVARDRFGIWRKTVIMEKRSKFDEFDSCCD